MIEIEVDGGARGKQGEKGNDGNTYNVQMRNITTLPAGSQATAKSELDTTNNTLYVDMGIPKGDQGREGPMGNTLFTTFDVIDGKLIAYYSTEDRDYDFQLNENKLEVILNGE